MFKLLLRSICIATFVASVAFSRSRSILLVADDQGHSIIGQPLFDTTNVASAVPLPTTGLPIFNASKGCIGVELFPGSGGGFTSFVATDLVIAFSSAVASLSISWCAFIGGRQCDALSSTTVLATSFNSTSGNYYRFPLPGGWTSSDSYARVGVFWCADSNTNTRPLGCPNVSMAFGFGGGGAAYFTSSNGRVYQPTSTEPCVMLVGSSPGRATPSRSPSPSALPETISASLTVTSTTTASNNGTACSGCGGNSNSGTSSSTWPPGIIAGIIIAGVAATVFAAAIIASCCRQWKAVAIDSDATQAIEVIGSRSVELAAPAGRSASGLTGGTGTSPSSETRHGASVHELISVFSSDTVTVDLTVPSGTQAPRAGNAKVQVVVVPSPLQVAEIVCAGSLHSLATPASAPPPLQTTNIPVAGMPVVVLATAHVFDAACGQLSAPASPSTGSSQRTSRAFTHCVDRDSSESKSGWRHWHGYSVGRSSYTSGGGASTLPVADASRREIGGQRLSSQAASIQTRSSTSGAATVVVPNPMAGPAATALPVPLRLLPQVAVPTSVAHRDRSSSPDSARDKISLSTRDCATDVSTEVTVTLENPLPHAMQVAASAASSAVIVQNPLGLSIAADLKDRSIRVQRLSTMH